MRRRTLTSLLLLWTAPPWPRKNAFAQGGTEPASPPSAAAPPRQALPSLKLPPDATAQPIAVAPLMRLGDEAMLRGDVARARSLYERAAAMQPEYAAAALAAGKTYDPNLLWMIGVPAATLSNPTSARTWYERAHALGDPAATTLLGSLR